MHTGVVCLGRRGVAAQLTGRVVGLGQGTQVKQVLNHPHMTSALGWDGIEEALL